VITRSAPEALVDEEKLATWQDTCAAGMSAVLVARQLSVAPNRLFRWRRLYVEEALSAVCAKGEVVPASE
jgi:transposase-like protein